MQTGDDFLLWLWFTRIWPLTHLRAAANAIRAWRKRPRSASVASPSATWSAISPDWLPWTCRGDAAAYLRSFVPRVEEAARHAECFPFA